MNRGLVVGNQCSVSTECGLLSGGTIADQSPCLSHNYPILASFHPGCSWQKWSVRKTLLEGINSMQPTDNLDPQGSRIARPGSAFRLCMGCIWADEAVQKSNRCALVLPRVLSWNQNAWASDLSMSKHHVVIRIPTFYQEENVPKVS
jgi:hypothetical protein